MKNLGKNFEKKILLKKKNFFLGLHGVLGAFLGPSLQVCGKIFFLEIFSLWENFGGQLAGLRNCG